MAVRNVCVIGGSRYFGKRVIQLLCAAGDHVTVVNRGSVAPPEGVTHLVADRDDEAGLAAVLGGREFDVVIDQVCYTPRQAAVARRVFGGRTGRYLMTSTVEVYASTTSSRPVPETAADPARQPVRLDQPWHDEDFLAAHYGEGKRQAEATFTRDPAFGFASIRVAHVLGGGREDFTGRLDHYIQRIRAGQPIAVHRKPRPATFVHHLEIAEFLFWAAGNDFLGPVNACSRGELTATELCEVISAHVGAKPVYRTVDGPEASPYSFDRYYGMDNGRASALGFTFSHIRDWLPTVIQEGL